MKNKVQCFLLLICCGGFCSAQQIVSTGGYVVKPEISVDWILGGSLSDIAAYDLVTLYNLRKEQIMETKIALKVYPIPATEFITIEITPVDTGRINLELYNSSGVKVLNKLNINQPVQQINIHDLPTGIYFLKVLMLQKNQLLGMGKIIKY